MAGGIIPFCRLLALTLTAALCASAGELRLQVEGRVVDENSTPVADVRVALLPADPAGPAAFVVTDTAGKFNVFLPAGAYNLATEREGFFSIANRRVEITGDTHVLDVRVPRLQQTSESINVVARVPAVDRQGTTSERRVTGRQFIDVPYPATRDFRNALRIIPGVMRHPSGRLSFEGGTENQVLYTLNGFNIGDPITGRFTTRMPVESVRSVDYSSGRYSPEFGKGSAGALAIQTTNGGDEFRYSATNFVPGIETQKGLHIGTWSPRVNFSGPVRRGRAWFSESVETEYSVAVIPDRPKGSDRTTRWRGASVLHGQVNLTPSQILSLDLLVGFERAPRSGLSALDPPSSSIDRGLRQYFGSVKDQIYFSRGMLVEAGYARTRGSSYERPQGRGIYVYTPEGRDGYYFLDSTQESQRDQFLANVFAPAFALLGSHQVKAGVDLDLVHFTQDATRTGYEQRSRTGALLSRTTFGGSGSFAMRNLQTASYVVDAWRVRPSLTLEYGVRQDWDELVRRTVLSPRASFAWSPFGSVNTRIAGGFAVIHDASSLNMFARELDQYSTTTFYDADGVAGAPLNTRFVADGRYLIPRYRNLSLGLEHRIGERLRFTAGVLRRRGGQGFTYAARAAEGGTLFELTNLRRDMYDSASFTIHHNFGKDYMWMANYTVSRALSNAVIDMNIDQPLHVFNNFGRLAFDAPHRLLSWGYLPGWSPNWAVAYLFDLRTGFPFSVVRDNGAIVGDVNSRRFPMNFALNLHLERKIRLGRCRFAVRAGFNNVTNTANASGVNNVIDSPNFLQYYGREGRHAVFRLRLLRQGE